MASGGSQNENMMKNVQSVVECDLESSVEIGDESKKKMDCLSSKSLQNQEKDQLSSNRSAEVSVCCKFGDIKLNEFVGTNVTERNAEDLNQSSDSLSSLSDSDLTSTDSEDSLALSESESITDVTPLNSPYCDSPLPQNRNIDAKSDDRNFPNPCRNYDYDSSGDNCHRPEVNVLMKAIEKLEATHSSEFDFRETMMRRRAASLSSEESKKIELENQRLFKRVISKQNRMRSMYSASNLPPGKTSSCKHQELMKNDGDNTVCFNFYLCVFFLYF